MDGHYVTVPREYLEGLENFKKEKEDKDNASMNKNAKVTYVARPNGKLDSLLILNETDANRVAGLVNDIIIVDENGRELRAVMVNRHL